MSENYQTEEEQIEAIKRWWAENGKSTVVGIVLAIAGVFGWQGWQKQQQESAYTASAVYQELLQAVSQSQGQLEGEALSTASHLADTLKADYSSSVYAQFASLYKAQFAVNANKLDEAEAELRWLLQQSPSAELAIQAHLRLARVLLAKQQFDQALAELTGPSAGYEALFNEVKGDIYLAKGESQKARDFYLQAKELNPGAANNLLELKLQQLQPSEEV